MIANPLAPVAVQLLPPLNTKLTVPLAAVIRMLNAPVVKTPTPLLRISPPGNEMLCDMDAGWIAAGRPVMPKDVELLVPLPAHKASVTSFPIRDHVDVHVTAVVSPVKVDVNVPVSGVMSTSPAAVGPRPERAPVLPVI